MAAATAILSMAYYQQRELVAAKDHLARARELVLEGWPEKRKGRDAAQDAWHLWLTAHLFLQEAENLIADAESPRSTK